MHEMSLCESVLKIMQEQARVQGFTQVKTVWLEIGDLAGVEKKAMRFGFDAVMKGSLAEGARLEIIEIPGQAWCEQCRKGITISQRYEPCDDCGGHLLQITAGEEMRIRELEVA